MSVLYINGVAVRENVGSESCCRLSDFSHSIDSVPLL